MAAGIAKVALYFATLQVTCLTRSTHLGINIHEHCFIQPQGCVQVDSSRLEDPFAPSGPSMQYKELGAWCHSLTATVHLSVNVVHRGQPQIPTSFNDNIRLRSYFCSSIGDAILTYSIPKR